MRLDVIRNGLTVPLQRAVTVLAAAAGLMLSGCSSTVTTFGGCTYTAKSMQHSLPVCESFSLNVSTKDGSRLDIYFQIPYSRVHFEKDFDEFKASYTVSFILHDEHGSMVRASDVDRTVVAQSYAETNSTLRDAFLKMFTLPPGSYTQEILVVDNRSHLQYRSSQRVEVKKFSKEDFSASDFLWFDYARLQQQGISLKPLFPSGLSYARDSVGMFQELYNVRRGDTVRLSLSYAFTVPNDSVETRFVSLTPPYNVRLSHCIRPPDSVYYRSDSVFVSPVDGLLQVFQHFPRLGAGVNTVTRKIFVYRNGAADSSVSTAKFPVYPSSFPHLNGVDEEIEALSYIAWPKEIDSIRAGDTPGSRLERLLRFWEDHGGTFRRREFYKRIEEANELFSSCTEGWKTPMGVTFMICGPPDYVECQGLTAEVWYYDIGGNRSFAIPFRLIFEHDNERYYELVPFSLNDFIWGDFVNRWRRQ